VWQGERPPESVIRVCRKCESKVESRSQAGERELWMRLREAEMHAVGMGSLRRTAW